MTAEDINKVVGRLELEGRFGQDNRAGFPGQLHRLSVMRRKKVSGEPVYDELSNLGCAFRHAL